MPKIESYMFFDGNCAEVMRFYQRTLGGKLDLMTHGQSPLGGQATPENRDRIMHGRLEIGTGAVLMASDTMNGEPYMGMNGFAISLEFPTGAEAERIYGVFADGGQALMPIQKTFWAEAFGMVIDRFGTPWMVHGGPIAPS